MSSIIFDAHRGSKNQGDPVLPAVGTTYYVSRTGSDSNTGTQTHPWKTIQKAANVVKPGSTVVVQAGNYPERVVIRQSGDLGLPISFEADGKVVMRGFTVIANYVTLRGFVITNTPNHIQNGWGIWVNGSNCLLERNFIHDTAEGGILLFVQPGAETQTHDCMVRNNRLYRNSFVGIEVRGRKNRIVANEIWGTIQNRTPALPPANDSDADGIHFFGSGHVIRRNYIHHIKYGIPENPNPHIDCFQTWGDGYYHEAARNIVLEQNFCVNMQSQALHEAGQGFMIESARNLLIRNNIIRAYRVLNVVNSDGLQIVNNTFMNNLRLTNAHGPVIISLSNTPNSMIKNNIFYDPQSQSIYFADTVSRQGVDIGYNCVFRSDGRVPAGTPFPNDLWNVNPLFVNPAAYDFHLGAASPAIDAGITLPNVPTDYDRRIRPQGLSHDIGAHEFSP